MFNYDKLNEAIEKSGKTKAHLCRKLGRPPYFLRDVVRIKTALSSGDQKILADELGVTVAWLNDEEENIKKEPVAVSNELSEEERQFILWYRTQASEKDKAIVKAIVEADNK